MDELYAQQIVTVQALAEKLQVAPMTIRRDLHVLEQQGLVKKSHGGAVLAESSVQEAAYHNRRLSMGTSLIHGGNVCVLYPKGHSG